MQKMILIMGLTALGLTLLLAEPAQAYRVVDQQGRSQWVCPRVSGGEPVRCEFFMAGCGGGRAQAVQFRMCTYRHPTPAERPRFGRMRHYPGPQAYDRRFTCPWR